MMKQKPTAYIIGAGVTGLSIAYQLAKSNQFNVFVYEKDKHIGGMANTLNKNGFLLDLGPHKFFSNMTTQLEEVKQIIEKENLLKIKKRSKICILNHFIDYPVKPTNIFKINALLGIKMVFDYGISILKRLFSKPQEKSYEDYLINRFGKTIYQLVFEPYAQKIWGNPRELDKEVATTRVVIPNFFEMIKQMILGIKSQSGFKISADYFYYPKLGSRVFPDKLLKKIHSLKGKVKLSSSFDSFIIKKNKVVSFKTGNEKILLKQNDILISTIALGDIIEKNNYLKNHLNQNISKLKNRNIILFYIVLNKNKVSDQNWFFFPEKKYLFNRVFEQKSFSPYMITKDKTVICCEITCNGTDKIWSQKEDKKTFSRVVDQLIKCQLVKPNEIIDYFTWRIEDIYPVYTIGFKKNLEEIFTLLDRVTNLFSIGRRGGFNYLGMVDCFDVAIKTSNYVLRKSNFKNIRMLRKSFFDYLVID